MFSEVSVIFVRWMHTFMVDEMEGYIKDNIWHLQSLSTDRLFKGELHCKNKLGSN